MPTATQKNGSTTNGKQRKSSASAETPLLTVNGVLRMIPLDQLVPTTDNRRQPITDSSLKSLVQSIKTNGVLQPIIARVHPTNKDCWEIRAGERRWRAARLAGLTTIPALVRSLDDEAALAVTLVENLQRHDLHPLEEAATVQRAIAEGFDLKALASKLGRTVPYLVRRASLSNLASVWQQAVRKNNSEVSRLSPAHLELIARLPPATQEKLAENDFTAILGRGFPTVDELRRLIDEDLQRLAAMPWDVDDETLEPKAGSCANCGKRSSKQHLLFPEFAGPTQRTDKEQDRCLDPHCFQSKVIGYLERCEGRLRAKHPSLQLVELGVDEVSAEVRNAFADRLRAVYYPHIVKASEDGAQAAMPINGPKLGKLIYLDSGASINGRQNGHTGRPRDEQGKVIPLTLEEKQARLQ
ncbi:MAG TPA: ParB/RepB/Spo0J family partition protein, partial [Terriglobales bacterium]|nr:ParB/RepB/Spo0J family partition protein [Terriglobales bacterium]